MIHLLYSLLLRGCLLINVDILHSEQDGSDCHVYTFNKCEVYLTLPLFSMLLPSANEVAERYVFTSKYLSMCPRQTSPWVDTPLGRPLQGRPPCPVHAGIHTPLPSACWDTPLHSYCSGWSASYWNAFLFLFLFRGAKAHSHRGKAKAIYSLMLDFFSLSFFVICILI